jgi:hypothetical protein
MKTYRSVHSNHSTYADKLFTVDESTKTVTIQMKSGDLVLDYRDIYTTPTSIRLVTVHYTINGEFVYETNP